MAQNDMIVFIGSSIFCGLVFVSLGIWAFVRKTPMHFWAGSTVLPETITDVKKYNRANGFMWIFVAVDARLIFPLFGWSGFTSHSLIVKIIFDLEIE